jgi:hypothetical protein
LTFPPLSSIQLLASFTVAYSLFSLIGTLAINPISYCPVSAGNSQQSFASNFDILIMLLIAGGKMYFTSILGDGGVFMSVPRKKLG